MMNDFLDNLGAHQYEKMRKRNAIKEEIINTCEETYGKENSRVVNSGVVGGK